MNFELILQNENVSYFCFFGGGLLRIIGNLFVVGDNKRRHFKKELTLI